ncbi:DUF6284 family protein [Streptomyces olivaceoviridis]|uniref:DUF6284 family protein n=1 Tax=Streptomyces olivaceoviridis TaxID=1921 RepID=UPI00378B4552
MCGCAAHRARLTFNGARPGAATPGFAGWMEPTDAELDAIEQEMPAILADVDLLDAQIATVDRSPSVLDARRTRRARRRALAARTELTNRLPSGEAA